MQKLLKNVYPEIELKQTRPDSLQRKEQRKHDLQMHRVPKKVLKPLQLKRKSCFPPHFPVTSPDYAKISCVLVWAVKVAKMIQISYTI